jgi:arylsulfatase A-like enzyme/Flp pilus assembly protein TadD
MTATSRVPPCKRAGIVLLLAATARPGAAGAGPGHAAETARASVLLVTLDTTRADHLGCYGARTAATANLDGLAASGVLFRSALAPAPLTLPSHATILTGQVPRRHGVRNNSLFPLRPDLPVLAEVFSRAGYRTAAFVSSVVLDRRLGLGRGFQHYDDTVRVGERSAFNYEERAASQTTEAVVDHLAKLEPPFFLWVHYFDPHLPYVPPEPYRSRFPDRPYDGEIAFVDHELGRLLVAARRRAPVLLVAVAGDHGESLGEHGEDGHGVFLYQATVRVPLVLAGPGLPAGTSVGGHVGLVDLAPTLLELVGLPSLDGADGRSVAGLLRKASPGSELEAGAPAAYELESFFPRFGYGWAPLRALVRGRFKYIEAPVPELYDVQADPGERRNLAAAERRTASRLEHELARRVGDDHPGASQLDPDLAEHARRLQALGYVGGSGGGPAGEALDPKDAIGLVRELDAARRELQLGDPKKAVPVLERLLGRSPNTVPAMLVLAQCHLALGDAEQAVAWDRRALELSPDDDLVHFNLANALSARAGQSQDALAQARTSYERTLELNPRHADAYLNYASLLMRHDGPAAARALLLRARAAGVQDPDLEAELGVLELARGATDEAEAAFQRSLGLNPCAPGVHAALGRIAYGRRDPAGAAAHYGRALSCQPSADVAKTLGSVYLHDLGDLEQARNAYRRALELSAPGDRDVETLRQILSELEPE